VKSSLKHMSLINFFGGLVVRLEDLRRHLAAKPVDFLIEEPGDQFGADRFAGVGERSIAFPHHRRIAEGQHLLQMLGQQPVEKHFVAVPHVGQDTFLARSSGCRVHPAPLTLECDTPDGSSPMSPNARRSAGVNAVPRLGIGLDSTYRPRARIRSG
jgi:hypothetical protein